MGRSLDFVILVHGTGAASRDIKNPKWWQPTSKFARSLATDLGPGYQIVKPFRWTGANLESHRREAGKALLRRLRLLDIRGESYHLLGHSHGGSVIWHALVQSHLQRAPLLGLKSWSTIGTPFLTFTRDPTGWRHFVGFFVSLFALFLLWPVVVEGFKDRIAIVREGNPWAVGLTIILVLLLTATIVFTFLHIGRHLWCGLQDRRRTRAERSAANHYGAKWLGIWHEFDEPIAGLRATLVDPMQLVSPRGAPPARMIKRIFWAWYDLTVVPVTNQWAWAVGMGHMQGADLFSLRMADASHAPNALKPGWAPLPQKVALEIASAADAKAAIAGSILRQKLRALGNCVGGDEAVANLASNISWQELIHTTYFDHSAVERVIRQHIKDELTAELAADDLLGHWRRNRPVAPDEVIVHRRSKLALPIARMAQVAGLTMLLAIAFRSSYSSWISPFTNSAQIEQIAATTLGPLSYTPASALGEATIRIAALEKATYVKGVDQVFDRGTREVFLPLAVAFGAANLSRDRMPLASEANFLHLLSRKARDETSEFDSRYAFFVGAASGYIVAGKTVPDEVVAALIDLGNIDTRQQFVRGGITLDGEFVEHTTEIIPRNLSSADIDFVAQGAAVLYAAGSTAFANDVMEALDRLLTNRKCENALNVALRIALLGSTTVETAIEHCDQPEGRERHFALAALAAHKAGHAPQAVQLYKRAAKAVENLDEDELRSSIILRLDLGQMEEAAGSVESLLKLWAESDWKLEDYRSLSSRQILDLAGRLRQTNMDELASRVIATGITTLAKRRFVGDAASILSAEGRSDEVVRLAQESHALAQQSLDRKYTSDQPSDEGRKEFEGDSARWASIHFADAASIFNADRNYTRAIQEYEHALALSYKIEPFAFLMMSQIYRACDAFFDSLQLSGGIASQWLVRAKEMMKHIPYEDRQHVLLAFSRRAAAAEQFYLARSLAELTGNPETILSGYSYILDTYLSHFDRERWALWGFVRPVVRVTRDQKVELDVLPRCEVEIRPKLKEEVEKKKRYGSEAESK